MSLKALGELPSEPVVTVPRAQYESVVISRAQYDALMTAAKALAHFVAIQSTYTNTPLQAEAIMRAVQSLRALRAAGIQTEET